MDRARVQVRDRNQLALHRVREIRCGGGGVGRPQGDLLALFHVSNRRLPNRDAKASRESCQPVFLGLREDKSASEVIRERES